MSIGGGVLFQPASLPVQPRLTKRAPDVWESARFMSIFLASSFSYSQALSTPAHTQVTQTVETVEKVGESRTKLQGSIG